MPLPSIPSQPVHGGVVLVSMPFDSPFHPSMGLSLLKAGLASSGVPVSILYLTLRYAETIGPSAYADIEWLVPSVRDLCGEWVFSAALFGEAHADPEPYLNEIVRPGWPSRDDDAVREAFIATLLAARAHAEPFLDAAVDDIARRQPRVVGFTSVFQQQVASLALARRLKARCPDICIVFGGANCEGVMGAETARQFPFVDAVVSGEGDVVFPELVRRAIAGEGLDDLPGVYTARNVERAAATGRYTNAQRLVDMDNAAVPDYDEYFAQLAATRLGHATHAHIMFESSRGCWWGERSHCTFCGLSDATMPFRGKSGRRSVDELVYLTGRYPGCAVVGVDWILSMRAFTDFLPELAARRLGVELFFEVKANLKKAQVRLLRDAGVRVIQPGIESFSSDVLERMRKGVKGLQNIQLLKWCKEFRVRPQWNLLWGFPGEPPEEYLRMTGLLPLLTHLPPPQGASAIRIDRFSPNFDHAEALGFVDVRPFAAYRHLYPFTPDVVANLAYYFTYGYRTPQPVESYTTGLIGLVQQWQQQYDRSELFSTDLGSLLLICDLRPATGESLLALSGVPRLLYTLCDSVQAVSVLEEAAGEMLGRPVSTTEILEHLQPLADRGLMVSEGRSWLSLAIPLGEYSPGPEALQRMQRLIASSGVRQVDSSALEHA
ncbi:MAG: RiPP maturation radical SAM C-methyltransferase [Acidobacteriota bacterium]